MSVVRRSLLFREYELELEEVQRLKWYESERAGRDIGLERAWIDWIVHHRSKWLRSRGRTIALRADGGMPAGPGIGAHQSR